MTTIYPFVPGANLRKGLLLLFFFFSLGGAAFSQCGVNIPDGELCEAPGSSNCEFYMCVAGSCVPSGSMYVPGTKCGCFADECYEDFCDSNGDCICGFFAASAGEKCASDQDICDGVTECDGISGRNCDGITTYPAAGCDDGIDCTHDCNPVIACVEYPINNLCDDSDVCTTDVCDTTGVAACTNVCSGLSGCSSHPACGASLPVELMNFRLEADGNMLSLEWMTAVETNNKGFEVELSKDGMAFVKVGFVEGAVTTTEAQFYDFSTPILSFGLNYARLKQLDIDGNFTYSKTLVVRTEISSPLVLESAFPNPFHKSTTLRFSVATAQETTLKIFDQRGSLVKVLHDGLTEGGKTYTYTLNGSELTPGMYFYQLSNETDYQIRKLFVY